MRYAETNTGAASHPIIAEFWRFDAEDMIEPIEHVIPPDGLVSVWTMRRADGGIFTGVTGPSARAARTTVETGMTIVGARMKPCAPARFFSRPLESIAGAMAPLAMLAPQYLDELEQAALPAFDGDFAPLEAAYDRLNAAAPPGDADAAAMAQALIDRHGEGSIRDLAAALGLTPKAARRRFVAGVGLNPKDFARIRRIRRACAEAMHETARWSAISLEAGFADQAHLARECRDIFEMTPREMRRALARIRHGAVFSA